MRWINRAAGIFALAVLAFGSTTSRSDDQPKAVDAVDRILADWQAKASTIQSVEVKFHRIDDAKGWGQTHYQGRAVMAAPNLALAEFTPVGADGKATAILERLIWDGRSIYQFEMEGHKVWHFSFPEEWQAPPSWLRIPFFYRMTVEDAKRDYAWELLREDQDRIFMKVSAKAWSARSTCFQSCILELDRKTFLPRQMIVTDAETETRQTFKPIDIKINTVKDTSDLTGPCLDAWTVSEVDCSKWPARLFWK
jgi:hypothetical protein